MNAHYTPEQIEDRFHIGWKSATFVYNLLLTGNRAESMRRAGFSEKTVRGGKPMEAGVKVSKVIDAFNAEFRNISPEESAGILRSCIQRLQDFAFGKKRDNLAMDAVKALLEISRPMQGAEAVAEQVPVPDITPEQLTEALRGAWGDNGI